MNWRERTLLALTIVGFVVPNTMTALFVVRHGLTIDGYLRHWGESLPATQLALDLIIAFVAFALWAAWEGHRLEMRSWWVPVPASILPRIFETRSALLRSGPSSSSVSVRM